MPLLLYFRKEGNRIVGTIKRWIKRSPLFLYLPLLPLLLVELTLESRFPLTMALTDDWYAFSYYFVCFVTGIIMASLGNTLWKAFIKIKDLSLITGIVASALVLWMMSGDKSDFWIHILKPVNTWSWILCIFGYSSKYLNRESKILTYRNKAVYPIYILHHTIIIFLGFILMDHPMLVGWKMMILILGTYSISLLLYEYIIRRVKYFRPLFGLKSK
jgi:hypothetical protein